MGAAPDLDVEPRAGARDVLAQETVLASLADRTLDAPQRQRVLPADVQVAVLTAGGQRGDRHPFDHGERIALHDDAVLEGARFGLVGVADEVMGPRGRARDGVPFAARRKRGTASPQKPGLCDLADDAFGAELDACRALGTARQRRDPARTRHGAREAAEAQLGPRLRSLGPSSAATPLH